MRSVNDSFIDWLVTVSESQSVTWVTHSGQWLTEWSDAFFLTYLLVVLVVYYYKTQASWVIYNCTKSKVKAHVLFSTCDFDSPSQSDWVQLSITPSPTLFFTMTVILHHRLYIYNNFMVYAKIIISQRGLIWWLAVTCRTPSVCQRYVTYSGTAMVSGRRHRKWLR